MRVTRISARASAQIRSSAACQRARAAGERVAVLLGPLGLPDAALLARLEKAGQAAERVLVLEPSTTDAGTLAVLAALRPVDWVVQADPATGAGLLLQIRPDALLCDAATAASLPAGLKSVLLAT